MRRSGSTGRAVLWLFACALGSACGGDDGDGDATPMCIDTLPADCNAGFDPTWDNVHDFVIQQSCGGPSGPGCHGPQGKQGELVLFDKAAAYRALLGMDGTDPRVVPNDPACSSLMERLTTDDEGRRMPRGGSSKLSDATICGVQQWIEQGAKQ